MGFNDGWVISLPLSKTAMFASDPNLGRIISAIGSSGENIIYERISSWYRDNGIISKGWS